MNPIYSDYVDPTAPMRGITALSIDIQPFGPEGSPRYGSNHDMKPTSPLQEHLIPGIHLNYAQAHSIVPVSSNSFSCLLFPFHGTISFSLKVRMFSSQLQARLTGGRKMVSTFLSAALLLARISSSSPVESRAANINPVIDTNFPDPATLRDNDSIWYAFATNDRGKKVQVAKASAM